MIGKSATQASLRGKTKQLPNRDVAALLVFAAKPSRIFALRVAHTRFGLCVRRVILVCAMHPEFGLGAIILLAVAVCKACLLYIHRGKEKPRKGGWFK